MTLSEIEAELARGRAEAVRMLDSWLMRDKTRAVTYAIDGDRVGIMLHDPDNIGRLRKRLFQGDSPEAARANAAEAIRGEL